MKILNIDIDGVLSLRFAPFQNVSFLHEIDNMQPREAIEKLISLEIPFIFSFNSYKNKFDMRNDFYILAQNDNGKVTYKVTPFNSMYVVDGRIIYSPLLSFNIDLIEDSLLTAKSREQLNTYRLLQKV